MNLKEAAQTYRPVWEKIHAEYPRMPFWRFTAEAKRLIEIASDARQLINKNILDLGSGSKEHADQGPLPLRMWNRIFNYGEYTRFHPWYARTAHAAGAKVTAVDIASNEDEEFQSLQMDLMNPDALSILDDESVDAVNNMCLTAPRDSKRASSGTSPAIMWKLGMDHEAAFKLNDQIAEQVRRILREGGTYTLSEFVYKKKKGKLKRVRVMEGLGA